ncbi:DNA-binding transcriptional regulator, FrmR family [Anaerobranca californiensis DSM 14826]|jgi:DNA-binding FrmR family transcriptional regulator|uniref:DNA-binding transcriptional regulator, FrmR family n=1 Tax=Anaerobranca californiensis DSM 14826 TaxID=1120989 RepID=A0A1M6KWI7_9FIRM|nr:metal-sensitive transcriptional regulator [Anaerobranca californiensis]SHJ63250.1 DNA-binding transcriptional regulator, FrmR family [Anaerobranca californiensis DSM 14826]
MDSNKELISRLKKIEGQIRGIQKMMEDGRYCVDILTQIAAVRSAITKVGILVLEKHTKGCVSEAIKNEEQEEKIAELMQVLSKFLK